MLPETIQTILTRDLTQLRLEIASYKNENTIWLTGKGISNSAGNLCLHLVGNLNTYIGAILGNTGYTRNRELEFSLKNIPAQELTEKIDATIAMIGNTMVQLTDEQLAAEYPVRVFDYTMTTGYFLVHLATHLGYHLGQVNYHRRLLDN